jgi:hypothetical protein
VDHLLESTFQYVAGRSDSVTLEQTRLLRDSIFECKVTVNGQACHSCYTRPDVMTGIHVHCENLERVWVIWICAMTRTKMLRGPLAVFAFHDPALLVQGCPPRIY